MMTCRIHYYGLLADQRGVAQETVTHEAATAEDLYQELTARHGITLLRDNVRAAVNDEIVVWSHPLSDGDDIAFLPPMSGG